MKSLKLKTKNQILKGICLPHLPFIDVGYSWSYYGNLIDCYVEAYDTSPEEYHILAKSINNYWELIDASL